MNNRLTIQDLAGLLAERTGKDRSSTEQFLKEFIAVVSQGVFTDKIAKVKGLGTFKILPVEQRESVKVNTGERFVIPAHYKFSFLPDKELREQVNKPFSFFETTELNDEVDFTDLDVSDSTDEKEVEDESIEEIFQEKEETHEPAPAPIEEVVPEKEEEPLPAEEPLPEKEEPETNPEPETEQPAQPASATDFPDTDYTFEEEDPAPSFWVKTSVSMGVAALIAIAAFFLYQHRSFFLGPEIPQTSLQTKGSLPGTATVPEDTIKQEASAIALPDTVAVEEPAEEKDTIPAETVPPTSNVLAKVKIEPGSRLTLISLKYYGSKIFWVYLYEFNKSIIKNPNNVPVGTEIQVPVPEVYGIDKNSRASVEKAAARQTEILNGNL